MFLNRKGQPKPAEKSEPTSETSNGSVETSSAIFPNSFTAVASASIAPPEDSLPPAKPTFQWGPSVPPSEPVFKGFCTNVGNDGMVHLYVINEGKILKYVNQIKNRYKYQSNGLVD